MTYIGKGANTPVPAAPLRVVVCRRHVPGGPAVDASALLLDAAGKVRGDADLVFYNQPAHPSGAVRHAGTADGGGQLAEWLEVDLPRVEPGVQRVLIAASCDGGVFGQVAELYAQVLTLEGAVVAHYAVDDASSETAFVLGEFYRRDGAWKFRAVGQGYASGLAGLATDFGIAVEQPAAPVAAAPAAPVAAAPAAPVAVAPPVHAPTVPAMPSAAPPAPAAMVAPPQDAPPVSFGSEFRPYTQSGRGAGVVSVDAPLPPGPVVVEAWHQGDGYFGVHTLDRRNKNDELVFNTTLRDFRGRALVQLPQGRPLRLRVEADEDWTVLVQPLSVVRRLGTAPLEGYGPEVVSYTGTAADLDVEFAGDENGEGYFAVKALEAGRLHDLDDYDLLVNEVDRLRNTVPLSDGPLLLAVEGDGPWRLTARPLPVHDEPSVRADGAHTGRGPKTVTLVNPTPGRPALLEYAFETQDDLWGHRVSLLDEYDDEEDLLRGTSDGRHGRTVLFRRGEARVRLKLQDVGGWSLRLLPIEQAPPLAGPVEGRGSAVFRYAGPPALLRLGRTTSDDQNLSVRTLQADGQLRISGETTRRRPVTGPVWVSPAGYCHVLVQTSDTTGWRLEPADPAGAPVLGPGPVEGQGYGVVRHAGPEAEVMVRHEALGQLSLPVLWELDERLEPVRRISTAAGLQRVPSGWVQIRTSGRWTLEPRP
ncbi:TerD family protein [Streptomyces sp. NPDC048182]|uniref:TerD family protein n=1 Tax=Streptomyces sp. NPDC048182 TaxID=3365507 RepID=UPI00371C0E60